MAGPTHAHAPKQAAPKTEATTAQVPATDDQSLYGNAFVASQLGAEGHDHHDHGHAPNPTGTATEELNTERPVGGDIPASIRDPLFASLRTSPRASSLMDTLEEERGDLAFPMKWSDRGSYQSAGSIWLDRHSNPSSWFGTMAHEMVHLLTHVSGQAANARRMTRDAYVAAKMEDEINAQAVAFVACLQTGQANGGAGFNEFVAWLRQEHPDLTVSESDEAADAANWAAIEEHAKSWLEAKYRNEWKTSNTGENYYDYWGGYWDTANRR